MICRYCHQPIHKTLIGWAHNAFHVPYWHWPRPVRRWDR